GVMLHRVEGEHVRVGEVVATVHAGDTARLPAALDEVAAAFGTGPDRGPAGVVTERLRGW
ncbi:MAG: thymidine phosphorylase, partial [Dietzia sp.]|nr:thymidine phosphorylase [Dietzia sp.]